MPLDRRSFLTLLGGAGLAWPGAVEALARQTALGGEPDDEDFWGFVRGQFLIPSDRIYLNNGTLGPSPHVVVDAVTEHTRRVAMTYPPGVSWDDLKGSLAGLLGGDPAGFVSPRNTTEAMNFVANGLDLERGAEVLSTDHEHIGGLEPWKLVTTRRGQTLRIASLPVPAALPGALLDAVWSDVTEATAVICVSHMTFTTGTVLPITELAERCVDRDIVLAVDGAHPPGMLQMDLRTLGGDFYATSPHKWLLAPQGTGLLVHQRAVAGAAVADARIRGLERYGLGSTSIQPSWHRGRVAAGGAARGVGVHVGAGHGADRTQGALPGGAAARRSGIDSRP